MRPSRFQQFSVLPLCAALTMAAGVAKAQTLPRAAARTEPFALLPEYQNLKRRLARGWNTWDVNSVTTQVLLPAGLAIHVSVKHNSTLYGDALLTDTLIGRLSKDAEQVLAGPHTWDGSYTELQVSWKGHKWRLQSAHENGDLVLLATPLLSDGKEPLAATLVFSVNYLWNRHGAIQRKGLEIEAQDRSGITPVYCICQQELEQLNISPIAGPYFAADFTGPMAVSTGKRRSLAEVQRVVVRARDRYEASLAAGKGGGPIMDAIETTLGWDTIFEPEKNRVVSPVSRVWSVNWGGYVIFDWDTFFAATMAGIGDKDLAYADAIETLREETAAGFVPNYARAGNWKSFDRSEPPVGAITVLGLYRKFGDLWFLRQTYPALLKWNEWWAAKRDIDGYLSWGSDGENPPGDLDDRERGTRAGAILESGLDNSPMYDDAVYDAQKHVLQFADVGLMSLYIADCNALAEMADELGQARDARALRERSAQYGQRLQTLWSENLGIFLNKNLKTGQFSARLSPTNFYPMMAGAATEEQARTMVDKHLLNTQEFWGEWVIPSIARNDAAFQDQNYWRGRIWGPMNYLVYLGLRNYSVRDVREQFVNKSYALFYKEWQEHRHVHENYNAIRGEGDDVSSSDRFYHWGALLGYVKFWEDSDVSREKNRVNTRAW